MRGLGCALLLGGGIWLGLLLRAGLCRRVTSLESWIAAVSVLESELSFLCPDLPFLLETAVTRVSGSAGKVLRLLRERMTELDRVPFAVLWREALCLHAGELTGEDAAMLSRLGDILGRYGIQEQIELLSRLRGELTRQLTAARRERREKGRVYIALGSVLGCFLTILLM